MQRLLAQHFVGQNEHGISAQSCVEQGHCNVNYGINGDVRFEIWHVQGVAQLMNFQIGRPHQVHDYVQLGVVQKGAVCSAWE